MSVDWNIRLIAHTTTGNRILFSVNLRSGEVFIRRPEDPVDAAQPVAQFADMTEDSQHPDLLFVTCGGTIDKIYFDAKGEYAVGPPQVAGLLEEANVGFHYAILPVVRKDSLEMTAEDRATIRETIAEQGCLRVVVTHGTDTMIQTALALRGLAGRTIVLTGSMQPARFRVSDAEFNLGTAVMAAQVLPPGIYVAMNGRIFDPAQSRKNVAANRFEAVGSDEPLD